MTIRPPVSRDPHRYDDLLELPHPQSRRHPRMDALARAAQFSPFAALTGYDDQVKEAARLTGRRVGLSEGEQEALDAQLCLLRSHLGDMPRPVVSVRFFVPDERKAGGRYETVTGCVRRIDPVGRALVFYAENGISSGRSIPLDAVFSITGELFERLCPAED